MRFAPIQVFVPPAKDLYFFDRYYEKGLAWYLSHFQGGRRARRGRAVARLPLPEEAPDRIRADLPDVQLICCLRNLWTACVFRVCLQPNHRPGRLGID